MGASTRKRLLDIISSQLSEGHAISIGYKEGRFDPERVELAEIEFTIYDKDDIIMPIYDSIRRDLASKRIFCQLNLAYRAYQTNTKKYKFRIEGRKNLSSKLYEQQTQAIISRIPRLLIEHYQRKEKDSPEKEYL